MSLRKHSAVKIAHWLADGAEKARVAGDVAASLELAMKAAEYLQLARAMEARDVKGEGCERGADGGN